MPAFNYERAATALVDAHSYGDKYAAKMHNITRRSLRRWRRLLVTDSCLQCFVETRQRNFFSPDLVEESSLESSLVEKIKTTRRYNQPTCVYLIRATNGLVKIGIAKNVERRLQQLDNMSPVPLRLIAAMETKHARILESELHELFSSKQVRGEWFDLNDEDIMRILKLANDM